MLMLLACVNIQEYGTTFFSFIHPHKPIDIYYICKISISKSFFLEMVICATRLIKYVP